MNDIKTLFQKLENSYLFQKKFDNRIAILEIVLALLTGGFVGSWIQKYNLSDVVLSITFGIIFLFLAHRRYVKEQNYSTSLLGELEATIDLENAKKEIERKSIIDTYISEAIKALNSNTCNYDGNNVENFLCDTSLLEGIKSIYQPFFNNAPNLLDTAKAKFTVGAYLEWAYSLPTDYETVLRTPVVGPNIFILRDDFGWSEYFVPNMLNAALTDLSFHLQNQFKDSFIHEVFKLHEVEIEQNYYTVISAPIPTVCEDGSIGVFFMVADGKITPPKDFENLLAIFGKLFANWQLKFNECVVNRCKTHSDRIIAASGNGFIPPEVEIMRQQGFNQDNNETTIPQSPQQ